MALKLSPTWAVDGVALSRNPDSFIYQFDKANVTYEKQAAGNQLRIQAPRLTTAIDVTLTWKLAPRRVVRNILQYCNNSYPLPGSPHTITIDGIQPALVLKGYFDTPKLEMSKDNLSTKTGEGGTLQDLTMTIRSDSKGFQSLNFVPVGSSSTPAQVQGSFGGQIGNYLDYLPKWDGASYWTQPFASSTTMTVYNLGNQEWLPVVKIDGPFSTFSMTELNSDVDGTGLGVKFLWTGSPILTGQGVFFNTFQNRCYTQIGSSLTEVFTFVLQTVSDGQPFGYWPGMVVGSNSFVVSATGSFTNFTLVDFSNNNQERFRYWA
jgi:hypothetical protein